MSPLPGPVLQTGHVIEKLHQLLLAQNHGEFAGAVCPDKAVVAPRHLQSYRVEKLNCRNILIDALWRELSLIDQVDIVSLSGRREIAQLHIVDHSLDRKSVV